MSRKEGYMSFNLKQLAVSLMLTGTMVLGSFSVYASPNPVTTAAGTSPTSLTMTHGQALQKLGLVKGNDQGLQEDKSLTREEMVALLYRLSAPLAQSTESTSPDPLVPQEQRFSDVPSTHWAYTIIENSAQKGITSGLGNGQFGLGQQVTYRQALLMLVRTLNAQNSTDTWVPKAPQLDLSTIEAYAKSQYHLESTSAKQAIVFARKHSFELVVQALKVVDQTGIPWYKRLMGEDIQSVQGFEMALVDLEIISAQNPKSPSATQKKSIAIVKKENYGTANDDRYRNFLAQAMKANYQKGTFQDFSNALAKGNLSKKPEFTYTQSSGVLAHMLLSEVAVSGKPGGTVLFRDSAGMVAKRSYSALNTYTGKGTFENQNIIFHLVQFSDSTGKDSFTILVAVDGSKAVKLGLINGSQATNFMFLTVSAPTIAVYAADTPLSVIQFVVTQESDPAPETDPNLKVEVKPEQGLLYVALKGTTYYPSNALHYQNYLKSNPKIDLQGAIKTVNLNLDRPFYSGIQPVKDPNSLGLLCNKYFQMARNFVPTGLVKMDPKYGKGGRVYQIRKEAYEAYQKMAADAAKKGLKLLVVSAYRSYDVQSGLYASYVKRSGRAGADNYSARAGHSEHQTGLALDINAVSAGFGATQEFKWLNENGANYGFILRYPKDKTWLTGYIYEPWHWRFVGVDAALAMKKSQLTYEEWLQAH